MNALFYRFNSDLDSLSQLIDYFEKETLLLDDFQLIPEDRVHQTFNALRNELVPFYTKKREYNYNSIIISLYGFFEKYIEDTLITTSDRINKIFHDYNRIPDSIREKHLNLSLRLLEKVISSNGRGNVNAEGIIKNLHQCVNIRSDYMLNNEAFSQHTFNFRIQAIQDAFSNLGIKNLKDLIIKEDNINQYLRVSKEKDSEELITSEEAFSTLDDLVERRNEVAHGVASEILSHDILREYIIYFRKFAFSLNKVVQYHLNLLEVNESGIKIGKPKELLRGKTIIIINNNFVEINKGDQLIGISMNQSVRARVINIQIDNVDVDKVGNMQDEEIGVLLDQQFKKSFNVFKI